MNRTLSTIFGQISELPEVSSCDGDFIPISPKRGGGDQLFINCILHPESEVSLIALRQLSRQIAVIVYERCLRGSFKSVCISIFKKRENEGIRLYRTIVASENLIDVSKVPFTSIVLSEESQDAKVASDLSLEKVDETD